MQRGAKKSRRSWSLTILVALIGFLVYLYLMTQADGFDLFQRFKGIIKFVLFQWQLFDEGDVPFLVDIFLFLAGFVVWIFFFGLFVLPIQTLNDGMSVFSRLILYLVGQHGPAVFIKDGEVDLRPIGDARGRGPGFALLDTASAAVLRNAVAFRRTIGPGLSFTGSGEYLSDAVDLHVQLLTQALGPQRGDDPFSPRKPNEDEADYIARQQRCLQTSGLTRDGVEVVPNITVLFRLDPSEDKDDISAHGNQFGYYPKAVYKAVTSEAINPNAEQGENRKIPWREHAAYMAVDLWREYLRKFTLNELFNPFGQGNPHEGCTAYEIIQDMVRRRLTEREVEALDANGRPSGRLVPSREYQALKNRGIQVLDAPVRNLRLPPTIEQQLVKQWFASWEYRARSEREAIERQRSYRAHQGEQDALKDFSRWVVRRFEPDLLNAPPPVSREEQVVLLKRSLENFLRGTLDQCITDTQIHHRLTNEENMLDAVLDWVQRQPENAWDELN